MDGSTLQKELLGKDQGRREVCDSEEKIFLENDTLIVIQDEGTAIRRLDLETCNIMQLPSAPDFQIYYRTCAKNNMGDSMGDLDLRIVAISKVVKESEKKDLGIISRILVDKLRIWNKKLELKLSISKIENFNIGGEVKSNIKIPTLLELLNLLCSDKITTSKQRKEIRDAINMYLVGEVHYNDVYTILERILGRELLYHTIISLGNSLERSECDGDIDYSWMIRSFEFDNEDSLYNKLNCYLKIQDFFMDNSRLYPFFEFDSSEKVPYVGHSTVNCGPYVIFLGGIKSVENKTDEKRHILLNDFETISVLDTNSFDIKTFKSLGVPANPSMYHSSNLILTKDGPKIVVSGGILTKERDSEQEFCFSTTTSIFNMKTREWTIQDNHSNTPRMLHSTLTYPQFSTNRESKFIIVFGGLTKSMDEITPSNDMWIYSIKDNYWTQVAVFPAPNSAQTELPSPRFGHSMVWVDDKTFYIYGGEGINVNDQTKKGVVLNDVWSFTINSTDNDISNLYIKGYWTKIKTTGSPLPFSTLHSCIPLGIPGNANLKCSGENNGHNDKIATLSFDDKDKGRRRVLIFLGGMSFPKISEYPINLNGSKGVSFLLNEQEKTKIKSIGTNIKFSVLQVETNECKTIEKIRISALSPTSDGILSSESKSLANKELDCMFISNSTVHLFEGYTSNKNTKSPYLLLQGYYGTKEDVNMERTLFVLSILGHEPFGKQQSNTCQKELGLISLSKCDNESVDNTIILDNIKPFVRPMLRNTFTLSDSIFASMSSSQKWLFGAFSHLFDNSFSTKNRSTFAELNINEDFISFTDDGTGLCYTEMESLLRHFGTLNKDGAYGLGFKYAFSRISESCIIYTKTREFIGMGLIATCILNSENMNDTKHWTPICYWHQDTLEPFIPINSNILEHRQKQKLILRYSPISNPKILCDHFSSFKSSTGTKLIFSFSKNKLKLHKNQYLEISENGLNLLSSDNSLLDKNSNFESYIANTSSFDEDNSQVPDVLPFWNSNRNSIDFCLSTYLHWLYLNKTQSIYCQGRLLSLNKGAPESQCLYDFLLSNLKKPVKLSRIIKDNSYIDNDGSFGIIGVVSDVSVENKDSATLNAESREGFNAENGNALKNDTCNTVAESSIDDNVKLMETGVLLYYNGRLIRRLESHFPSNRLSGKLSGSHSSPYQVTAVINVPQWLVPSANKQEFVLENTGVFEEFQNSVERIVNEYIERFDDDAKLKEWESEFNHDYSQDCRPSKIPKFEN
ncbi:kelch repeat-containing proteins that is fused to a HSP90-like ATpase [Cryptosporidium ryanae]|uniref:kelch repeat-containing proteins that is fused to a HSP90-like ATpase n=1 Tax=Cryptosporidium ryanae TaxID=515981 RepID=UPI003519E1B8|nr:kelch repeat-containing proteins that is fused to a HSP90-like ATpase [Cryptosporidium ryanae]